MSDWADKIAKLLAKAESTNSPAEAEAFTAKAQELMRKYEIDEAMVAAARGFDRGAIDEDAWTFTGTYRHGMMSLAYEVAEASGLQACYDDNPTKRVMRVHIAGFEGDRARAGVLQASLQIQMARALDAWWRDYEDASALDRNRKFAARRSFMMAYAGRIGQRLREANATADVEHESDSVALVLRDKSLAVKDWTLEHWSVRETEVKLKGHLDGQQAGDAAARRADIGKTVGASSRRAIDKGA